MMTFILQPLLYYKAADEDGKSGSGIKSLIMGIGSIWGNLISQNMFRSSLMFPVYRVHVVQADDSSSCLRYVAAIDSH